MSILKWIQNYFKKNNQEDKRLVSFIVLMTGAKPLNLDVYKLALKHTSVSVKVLHQQDFRLSNERLEYLGDAILGAIVAEHLYKKYPYKEEGFLTEIRSRIVNRESLNQLSKKIGLIELVEREEKKYPNSHQSMAGDALEAFIGAVFLDKDFYFCKKFVLKHLLQPHIDIDKLVQTNSNFKSLLIEWVQKEGKEIEFITLNEEFSKGTTIFTVELLIEGKSIAQGMGQSKKKAEQAAAEKAFSVLNIQTKP